MHLASVGKAAFKIYTCHLLVFAAGAICGATEAFGVLCVIWGPCR